MSCGLAKLWRQSNTDALVYVHRRAISPALHWHSSEREKKLPNRLVASSFFHNIRPVELRSPTDLSHYPDRSLSEATWWILARFPQRARFNACKQETHLQKEQFRPHDLRRTNKSFVASKIRTLSLFRRSTRPSSVHAKFYYELETGHTFS